MKLRVALRLARSGEHRCLLPEGCRKGANCRQAGCRCHDGFDSLRTGAFCYSAPHMNSAAADISPAGELQTLLASRVPLVVIESREEGRVIELVRDAAMRAQRGRNWGVFQWTVTEGLLRVDVDMGGAQRTLAQPDQLLRHIKSTTHGRHLRAARLPPVPRESAVRAHAQGHRAGIRQVRAHPRAHQLRDEAAAGARAPGGALRGAPAGQERAPRHRDAHRARVGEAERRHAARSTSRRSRSWSTTSPACRCTTSSGSRARRSSTTARSPRTTSSRCSPPSTSC